MADSADFALGSALFLSLRLSIGFRSDFVGGSDLTPLKGAKIKRYKSHNHFSLGAICEDSMLVLDRTLHEFLKLYSESLDVYVLNL